MLRHVESGGAERDQGTRDAPVLGSWSDHHPYFVAVFDLALIMVVV